MSSPVMLFGIYTGRPVAEVIANDPVYAKWLVSLPPATKRTYGSIFRFIEDYYHPDTLEPRVDLSTLKKDKTNGPLDFLERGMPYLTQKLGYSNAIEEYRRRLKLY